MTETEIALLQREQVNLAFFLRIQMGEEAIRLYAGFGDFPVPAGGLETEGGVYTSVGRWGEQMPEIDFLRNAQLQAIDLSLSGVDAETVRAYLTDRSLLINAPAGFGWAVLDENFNLGGPIRWPIRGYISQPRLRRTRPQRDRQERTLGLTLIRGPVKRRRPEHTYLTGPDQRRRSPTDAFCDGTANLNIRAMRIWPN